MQLTPELNQLLTDIEAFSSIKRYRGMLPSKHALLFQPETIKELLEAGLIERLVVSFACGAENTLLRLTPDGRKMLHRGEEDQQTREQGETNLLYDDVTSSQFEILQDIHHYTMIKKYGGIMPNEEMKSYANRDVNSLFASGLIIRVKVETHSGKKRKGVILSEKGIRYLSALCSEDPWYALGFNPSMQKTS